MESLIAFTIEFRGPFRVGGLAPGEGIDARVDSAQLLPAMGLKGLMKAQASVILGARSELIEATFGSSKQECPWNWSQPSIEAPAVTHKARVEIENGTHTAVEGSLQFAEHVWARSATFQVELIGSIPEDSLQDQITLLRAAGRSVTSLGGQRLRGEGFVTIADGLNWTRSDSERVVSLRGSSKGVL